MTWLYLSCPTFSLVRITVLSLTLRRRSISSTRYQKTLLARSCAMFSNLTQWENNSSLLAEVSSPGKMCKRIKDNLYTILGSAWAYTSQMNYSRTCHFKLTEFYMKNKAIHLNAKTLKSVLFVKITVVTIDKTYRREETVQGT